MTTIRQPAAAEDLEEIRTLMRAYGAHLATAASICIGSLEQEIASLPEPYTLLLLAEVDAHPAGCVALKIIEGGIEMKRLYVSPAHRGHSLGRKLIEASIAWSRTHGFEAMYLDTVPAAMPEANALYERFGFQKIGRYNDNPVPGVVFYRLEL
jgi:GNAT superfamily N-acetyltransferase